MPSQPAGQFVAGLEARLGRLNRLPKSQSLFDIAGRVRIYVRYSRTHNGCSTFYGLRRIDLMQLEGFPSFICFLWDGQIAPLVVPYEDFREIFASVEPAADGQYKVQIEFGPEGTDMRLARVGRFGVDSYFGIDRIVDLVQQQPPSVRVPGLSHSQVQSLIAAIGSRTGHCIWAPMHDRSGMDASLFCISDMVERLPEFTANVLRVLQQVDLIWIDRRRNVIAGAFEVEHSTPIYSGLLRLNDVHIDFKLPRAAVVAQEERRSVFFNQVNRRTFQASGLSEVCVFYEYTDIYEWFVRLFGTHPYLPESTTSSPQA